MDEAQCLDDWVRGREHRRPPARAMARASQLTGPSIRPSLLLCLCCWVLLPETSPFLLVESTILDDAIASAATCCGSERIPPGVGCQGSEVVSLNFSRVAVGGPIPDEISSLSALTLLDLSYCSLTGNIPTELGQLRHLRVLNLAGNERMEGGIPAELGSISRLRYINLATLSAVSGAIPSEIGDLQDLTFLNLESTDISGTIPESLSKLKSLVSLDLGFAYGLTGSLPAGLGNLANLTKIRIAGASLSGAVPASFSGMTSLRELELYSSQLSGSIPEEIGSLTHLSVIRLSGNFLTGSLPSTLARLLRVETLLLTGNQLTGSLPFSLGRLSLLQDLRLKGNQFWGSIPASLTGLQRLTFLDVSSNFFSGLIPLPLGAADAELHFDSNFFTGATGRSPCRTTGFTAEGNCFAPSFPCAKSNNREALQCKQFCGTAADSKAWGPCGGLGVCMPVGAKATDDDLPLQVLHYHCVQCTNGTVPSWWAATPNQTCAAPLQQSPPSTQPPAVPPSSPPSAPAVPVSAVVGIALGGLFSVALIIGLVLWLFCCRKRRQAERTQSDEEDPEIKALRHFSLTELKAATNNFCAENKLGTGTFGEVFRGVLPGSDPQLPNYRIAVKRQVVKNKTRKADPQSLTTSFLHEAKIMAHADHSNLVAIRGCCYEEGQLLLVLDFVVNGNLRDLLNRSAAHAKGESPKANSLALTWERRLQLALGAARGLNYLHNEMKPEIVHLDFKSENILVDEHFNAKVSDFGIAKASRPSQDEDKGGTLKTRNYRGTPGYIDPYFYADPSLTKKSDVYSFGVVMLELATDWPPLEKGMHAHILHRVLSAANAEGFSSLAAPDIKRRLGTALDLVSEADEEKLNAPTGGEGPPVSKMLFRRFVCLALWCCAFIRTERPSMEQVVAILVSICEGEEQFGEEAYVLDMNGKVDEQVYSFVNAASRHNTLSSVASTGSLSSYFNSLSSRAFSGRDSLPLNFSPD